MGCSYYEGDGDLTMWTYYGTKKKIAKFYPAPNHDKIIEPFAGAAQYSLFGENWKKEVVLYDKYDVVVKIWEYLIGASEKDILSLPDMNFGDKIDDHDYLCDAEKYLIGFCINSGSASPKKTVAKFNCWNRQKLVIANDLYKVKHWKVYQCNSFDEIPNEDATWFIDPPYQFGGQYYRHSNKNIDYKNLADWCLTRIGQIIVCENTKAIWMDFIPLVNLNGQLHKTTEAIFYKEVNP